ncbi:MAG: phospholipase A2 [Pirellulaceae bacterium]
MNRLQGISASLLVFGVVLLMSSESHAQVWRPCGPDTLPPAIKHLVPQGSGGADFRPACQQHDNAYGSGCCCPSRYEVDVQFLNNMLNECSCSRNPQLCRQRAWHYYRMVRMFGEKQWLRYR